MTKLDDFLNAPSVVQTSGNSAWARRYAGEVRRIVQDHANEAPRTLQRHLGPSELGVECDRQVVAKMSRVPSTNHVGNPWPSVMGTAGHAWMEGAFIGENKRSGVLRFLAEHRVTPHPNHPGTSDLYDALERAVVDHKFLGPTSLDTIRDEPPRHYIVQLLLYAHGFRLLGLPVDRVAIIAWPRTRSTLNDLYVWERVHTPADNELLARVFEETARRTEWANLVQQQKLHINQIPVTPTKYCIWCPLYRPQSAYDGQYGCPGQIQSRVA